VAKPGIIRSELSCEREKIGPGKKGEDERSLYAFRLSGSGGARGDYQKALPVVVK